jgi:MFS family permease
MRAVRNQYTGRMVDKNLNTAGLGTGTRRMTACVALGTATVPLDTAVNVSFPHITGTFGVPVDSIQWIIIAYVLTYAALLLGAGRFADVFGYRRMFITGLVINGLAMYGCASAQTFDALVLARIGQGFGAALILSAGPALITLSAPDSKRTQMIGTYTIAFGLAGASGPLIGGMMIDWLGWSGVFWFRIPIVLAGLILTVALAKEPSIKAPSKGELDLTGIAGLVIGMTAALLAIGQAPRLGLDSSVLLGLIVAGIAGLSLYVYRQISHPDKALFDLKVIGDLRFTTVVIAHGLAAMGEFAVMLLIPYFLAANAGLGPISAGMVLAAAPGGIMFASYVVKRFAPSGVPNMAAGAAIFISAGALATISVWSPSPSIPTMVLCLGAVGFGYGVYHVTAMDRVMGTLPLHQRGVAGSISMLVRTAGVVGSASLLSWWFIRAGGNSAESLHEALTSSFVVAASIAAAGFVVFTVGAFLARTATDSAS